MILLLCLTNFSTANHHEAVAFGEKSVNDSATANQKEMRDLEEGRWGFSPPDDDSPPEPSPTPEPTRRPTQSPTPEPTETVTEEPTDPPTVSPTENPTASPTASPTEKPSAAPSDAPSASPSSQPSTSPTTYPKQYIEAKGIVMSLMNIDPLDEEAEENWANITEAHLANEIWNTINPVWVDVKVTLVAQEPPFIVRGLRRLQARRQQDITFNANYSIEVEMQISDINIFLTGAFVSNFKRTIYMESLKESGDAVFQNISMVSVEPASAFPTDDPNDKHPYAPESHTGESDNPLGTIVAVVVVILIVFILGLACYMRCRRQNPKGKNISSDRSGTSDESIENSSGKDSKSERSDVTSNASIFNYRQKQQAGAGTSTGVLSNFLPKQQTRSTQSVNGYPLPSFASLCWNRSVEKSSSRSTFGTSNSDKEEEIVCDEITVEVPKGKLGLVLETNDDGYPTVQAIKPNSPFHGRVQIGDRLQSVDGNDMCNISSESISRVIAWKQNQQTRLFVFGRPYGTK